LEGGWKGVIVDMYVGVGRRAGCGGEYITASCVCELCYLQNIFPRSFRDVVRVPRISYCVLSVMEG
jgi:hypothetical protein